jgi:hypothetical protein
LPDSKPCANFVLNKIELINIFPFWGFYLEMD